MSISFTQEGYDKLLKEQAELTGKRVEAVELLRIAREMGDLSENGAYKAARMRLNQTDARLRRLKYLLKEGKVIEKKFEGVVDFGTSVTLESGGKTFKYRIVGIFESDPSKNSLSPSSPIGRALMGKREGDRVKVVIPAGTVEYSILKIEAD